MEMRGSDFTLRNTTDVLVITLGSEDEKFDLRVMVPTKGILDDMTRAAGLVDDVMDGKADADGCLDEVFALICRAMSHNTDARAITPDFLDEMGFTLSDAALFVGDFTQFMTLLMMGKN